MAIEITCPGCKTRLTFDDDRAGETGECPECAESLQIKKPPRARAVKSDEKDEEEEELDEDELEAARRRKRVLPNPAKSFRWWTSNLKGGKFPFTCPDCRKLIKLRNRVTTEKRTCSKCGFKITANEIDKQLAEMEPQRRELMDRPSGNSNNGCGGAILFVLLPALALGALVGCGKSTPTTAPKPAPANPPITLPSREVTYEPPNLLDGGLTNTGQQLFLKLQCINCHNGTDKGKGPVLEGLWKAKIALTDGTVVTADEAYITESIRAPKAKVVAGWETVPAACDKYNVTNDEMSALIEFIRSLRPLAKKEQSSSPSSAPK